MIRECDTISYLAVRIHAIRTRFNLWTKFRRSDKYISHLRKLGVKVGKDVVFQHPKKSSLDLSRPYLVTIGNNVIITTGVHILTHDFTWMILREIHKRPFGSAGEVKIGDNVFIGMNAIILKGVHIGSNVVIGAGAVVYKDIPDNSIVSGNPARVITTMEKAFEKHVERELKEAGLVARAIRDRYQREPIPSDFKEFFYLFLPRNRKNFGKIPVDHQVGSYMKEFMSSNPRFPSFEAFLKAIEDE